MATRTGGGETEPSSSEATIRNPGDQATPGAPQTGEVTCPRCHGTGRIEGGNCPDCGGTGQVVQFVGDA